MGKEWYWVSGKSSKRGGGVGGGGGGGVGGGANKDSGSAPSGCMCSVFQLFDFHQFQFPSQQHQSSLKPPVSFLPEAPELEPPISKGVEAPRNSLELEEPSSPTTVLTEDEILNIPMSIQIKTNRDSTSSKPNDSSSEISSSPSTKTPNLVARLMGLDLLPDQAYSPISSSSNLGTPNNPVGKSHLNHHLRRRQPLQSKTSSHRNSLDGDHFSGTRSLPETPRISSARRSDVEHRLSLQINKENLSPGEEMILSRISSLKRKELKIEEENRSPGHYARQIVKQVKESVSRKVGLDITNTVRNKQEVVNQLKSKKMTKILTTVAQDSKTGKQTAASCSPRLKFLESRHKPISNVLSDKDHNNISQPSVSGNSQVKIMSQKSKAPTTKPKLQAVQEQEQHHRPIKKCKKVTEERFGPPKLKKPPQTSDIIRNKQEEPFVSPTVTRPNIPDKKCKKTPLSNDLLNITVPTLLPVKKDPMPPATKIPQKPAPKAQETKRSSQLSSCSSHSYKQREAMHATFNALDSNNRDSFNGAVAAVVTTTTTTTTTGDGAAAAEAEYEYITRILRRTGIDKDTPVSFTRWFSPSHPLDPSIFYRLEYFTTLSPSATTTSEKYICGELTLRCNRKLLFHLIDEILVEILKPYLNMKPWASSLSERCDFNMHGSNLIDLLCSKVRSFPCADCRLLEDIDALVDKDMPVLKGQTEVAFGEEGEGIVNEIEKDLLETLIHETAVIFYGGGNGK